MNMVPAAQKSRIGLASVSEAQAEVFWMAFQALPADAKLVVRQRLLVGTEMPPDLAIELQSWQTAAAEALMNFEELLHEAQ